MVAHPTGRTNPRSRAGCAIVLALALTPLLASSAHAASPVPLGTADSFALLAGSTITNTGATTVTGDIGLCCTGLATTGFGSLTQPGGAQYVGPGTAAQSAQDDLDIAYANAAGQPVTNTVPADLSLTGTPANPLLPGVYESTAQGALQINTGLTLDFQGDPNAVFIFRGTTLITAVGTGGSVNIVNGGTAPSACNIFWQLSDPTQAVTLGTSSAFKGTTMALGASTLGTGATVEGRILTRRSKAVTLDTNTITRTGCFAPAASGGGTSAGGTGGTGPSGGTATPTPTPEAATAPPLTAPVGASPSPTPPGSTTATPPGTARITGPRGPVTGPFSIAVTGGQISSVVFYLDGRRVKTVPAKAGRKKFTLKIDPRRQSRRVHRITARVRFTVKSRTPMTSVRIVYRRPPVASGPPRFTG